MDYERFIQEVELRGGFKTRVLALRATTATLSALGQELVEDEALAAARTLPESFGQLLRNAPHTDALSLDELYRRISEAEGVALGIAVEHAQIVCQVLAEALDGETRIRLQKHLPVELAALLTPREAPPEAPLPERREVPAPPGAGTTLATGAPGSHRPLHSAKP